MKLLATELFILTGESLCEQTIENDNLRPGIRLKSSTLLKFATEVFHIFSDVITLPSEIICSPY